MSDVYINFQNLMESTDCNFFCALLISAVGNHYIAKDDNGAPVFLISQENTSLYQPDIRFKYFYVEFNVECEIHCNDNLIKGFFCLVKFNEEFSNLYQIFIRTLNANLTSFLKKLTVVEIHSYITQLGELFRLSNNPSSREIVGLWAELYIIYKAKNKMIAMTSWRCSKFSRFDFNHSQKVFEIKATLKESRIHRFALEQLNEPLPKEGFVVSCLLQRVNDGLGILDLAKNIEVAVIANHDLRNKLWENIINVLGQDFSAESDMLFDEAYADKNISLYSFSDIPKPHVVDSKNITSVKFNVDISNVRCIQDLHSVSNLFDCFGN